MRRTAHRNDHSHQTPTRVPTQREVLRDVMLVSAKYGAWMTLRELSRLTGYGEASISAQLRHLRLRRHGGYLLHKRVRRGEVVRSEEHFVVWEYRLRHRPRQKLKVRGGFANASRCGPRQAR